MTNSTYLKTVRDQYEDFPYPPRDPEKELELTCIPLYDRLDLLLFYCYGGKKDFAKGFRALVAGGGTGDATIYLAERLRDTDAQIIHLDISHNSLEIAKKRAAKRKLKNITWVQRSLLDLPNMPELGTFDYINCSGVLHHLADPDAGLRALNSVLKDDGAIGIMVYGKYGRAGIYPLQETMRLLTQQVPSKAKQVDLCNKLLPILPNGNWYHHHKRHFEGGIKSLGDAEVFDLFLHSQDRPYTVSEIYDWVERCGLSLLNFIYYDGLARVIYNPRTFLPNAELATLAANLPLKDQQALAELLYGEILMHFFYVAKQPLKLPEISDESVIPFFTNIMGFEDTKQEILKHLRADASPSVTLLNARQSGKAVLQRGSYIEIMIQLIDGKHTIAQIYQKLREQKPDANAMLVKTEFKHLYDVLHAMDWLLLKY